MAKGVLHLNVEFSAVSDEEGKFARLAALLGLADADHARGKCEHLWVACTRRGESALPQWLVEQALGEHGPAALVESELASWAAGRGDSKTRRLRIGGAVKHCLWLAANEVNKHEQRRKGGKTRADASSRQLDGTFAKSGDVHPAQSSSSASASASASASDKEREWSAEPSAGLLVLSESDSEPARRKATRKPFSCTPAERELALRVLAKLGERNRIAYTGCADHVRLIVERHREGRDELVLRKIIAYCAESLEWEDDPKMHRHLCPETLFGPRTISKYHDAALSWAERAYPVAKTEAVR